MGEGGRWLVYLVDGPGLKGKSFLRERGFNIFINCIAQFMDDSLDQFVQEI
jgi:hypothetical protein